MALIRIDQRPLLELVIEFETPIAAAAGEPDLAGKYGKKVRQTISLISVSCCGIRLPPTPAFPIIKGKWRYSSVIVVALVAGPSSYELP